MGISENPADGWIEPQANSSAKLSSYRPDPRLFREVRARMANWIVTCKNCGNAFACAPISDSLSDFCLPQKPDFPPEGLERECPHCSSKFNYEMHEISYRD